MHFDTIVIGGGLSGLVSWLMITTLLSVDTVRVLIPSVAADPEKILRS